jgi:5'-nucleotidase
VGRHFNFSCQIHDIPIASADKIDTELKAIVDLEMEEYMKFDKVVGYADCPLEARFKIIRTQESNYGNFFVDMFRYYYNSDIAFLNSGCIRNDIVLPEGNIKLSKLSNIIDDIVIVKAIPGFAVFNML